MNLYYPYDPSSTIRVEEKATVTDRMVFLRHIPKQGSIEITDFWGDPAGIIETTNREPAKNRFFCDYALDSLYRDANRTLIFNSFNEGDMLTFTYTAIGTVITADDLNEIKAHLENSALHGSAAFFSNNTDKMISVASMDSRRHDDLFWEGSELAAIDAAFTQEVGRAPKVGDIVQFYLPGNDVINILRTQNKWWNLDPFTNGSPDWSDINPFLTAYDRQKLDALDTSGYEVQSFTKTFYREEEIYDSIEYNTRPRYEWSYAAYNFAAPSVEPHMIYELRVPKDVFDVHVYPEPEDITINRLAFSFTEEDDYLIVSYKQLVKKSDALNATNDAAPVNFVPTKKHALLKARRDELSVLNQQINDLREQLAADRKLLDYLHLHLDSELGDD